MADLRGFNANTIEPKTEYVPIPAGKYLAVITASQMKPNKAGTGQFLELCFQIVEGEHKGRQVWSRLNLENPNDLAVTIAQSELSAICRAVGVMEPSDSSELHNLPLVLTVRCKKRKDNDQIANEISGYAKREAATGRPQQAAASTPPWRRP